MYRVIRKSRERQCQRDVSSDGTLMGFEVANARVGFGVSQLGIDIDNFLASFGNHMARNLSISIPRWKG